MGGEGHVARTVSRRGFLKGLTAVGIAAGGGLMVPGRALAHPAGSTSMDPVEHRAYDNLMDFTGWLKREGVKGYVGEVGWPSNRYREEFNDQEKWGALAEKWYRWADAAGLWVTAHDANERQLYGGYAMSIYTSVGRDGRRAISEPKFQARVVENHPSTAAYLRGLNMDTGDNIDPNVFHQGNLGAFNQTGGNNYWYAGVANDGPGGQNSFEYLRGRGIRVVRLGFRWERFMPGGPGTRLSAVEVGRYRASLNAAAAAGMRVIMDVHNYGGYYFEEGGRGVRRPLNGEKVTIRHFGGLWRRLSLAFKDHPAVAAYDLMNEPFNDGGIAQGSFGSEERAWERATQVAVDRIRANGDRKLIMVPTYCGVNGVQQTHPRKWISDPARNHMYTAHQYFDTYRGPGTGGGKYKNSYDNEVAHLRNRGY